MDDGFYWVKVAGEDWMVVEVFGGDMYRASTEEVWRLNAAGKWGDSFTAIDVERVEGPLIPPA